jgi:hypothetical protein
MPHTSIWEPGGLYRKFTGTISGEEILESNFELHMDPNFQSINYIINDFTEVTGHSIEIVHTKVYASTDEIVSITKGKLKIALVVTQGPLIELANSYREEMIGNRFECDIFQTIEDARKWISNE